MRSQSLDSRPPEEATELFVQTGEEFLIYDRRTNRAHCLNRIAAEVWKLCDGVRTCGEIISALNRAFDARADEDVVWMALRRLDRARLFEKRLVFPADRRPLSRRDLLRRMEGAARAAVAGDHVNPGSDTGPGGLLHPLSEPVFVVGSSVLSTVYSPASRTESGLPLAWSRCMGSSL